MKYKILMWLLIIVILMITPASAAWWSNSRQYSSSSSVVNPNTTVVILNLSNASGVSNSTYIFGNGSFLSNFHSLNFTVDNLTEIPFWLENISNGVAIVRVNVSTATVGKIVNAYWSNNTDDGSASNATATFIKWHGGATSQFVDSATQTIPYIYESKARITSDPATNQVYFGVSNIQDFAVGASDSVAITGSTTTNFKISTASRKNGVDTSYLFTPNWNQNQYYKIKIVANSTSRVDYYGYNPFTLTQTITTNNPTLAGGLAYYALSGTGEQEYSFIRGMASPDPTWNSWSSRITSPYYATNWTNNYTNDQQTTISITANQYINFSMTTNTTTTSYYWWFDGANQSTPYNNYTTSFSTGAHTVTATFYNSTQGLWANKSWYVTLQMVLTLPANGSTIYFNYPPLTTSVNHTWTTAGYPYYNIQVSNDPDFNVLLLDTYTSNPYYTQSMGAGTKYWRVRNYDQTNLTYGNFTPWFNYTLIANASTPSGNAGIIGIVYELVSGTQTPISGATVYIQSSTGNWSSQMTTGSNGYYRFDNLTNNTVYYVYSTKKDYQNSVTEYVTTGIGTWTTRDIFMKPTEPTFFESDKQYVKFKVRWLYCFWNCDIQDAIITVYKYGDVVSTYSGLTDSTGTAKFLLFKTQLYRVTVTNASAGINQEMKVYGSETDYIFLVTNQPTTWNTHTIPESTAINISISKNTTDNTHANITVSYSESVGTTTLLNIYINQTNGSSAQTTVASGSYGSAGSHTFPIVNQSGQSYLVHIVATHTEYGTIDRTYVVSFDKINGMNQYGIPESVWLWFAMAIMFFTAAIFTASTAEKGFVIMCAEGWIFLAMGMFSTINVIQFGIGLTIATIISIFAYIRVSQTQAGYT